MSNEEQILGFDVREMWSQMDATWSQQGVGVPGLRHSR